MVETIGKWCPAHLQSPIRRCPPSLGTFCSIVKVSAQLLLPKVFYQRTLYAKVVGRTQSDTCQPPTKLCNRLCQICSVILFHQTHSILPQLPRQDNIHLLLFLRKRPMALFLCIHFL